MESIDAAAARQIVAELDAGKLARAAWREMVPDESGRGRFALVALDWSSLSSYSWRGRRTRPRRLPPHRL